MYTRDQIDPVAEEIVSYLKAVHPDPVALSDFTDAHDGLALVVIGQLVQDGWVTWTPNGLILGPDSLVEMPNE